MPVRFKMRSISHTCENMAKCVLRRVLKYNTGELSLITDTSEDVLTSLYIDFHPLFAELFGEE